MQPKTFFEQEPLFQPIVHHFEQQHQVILNELKSHSENLSNLFVKWPDYENAKTEDYSESSDWCVLGLFGFGFENVAMTALFPETWKIIQHVQTTYGMKTPTVGFSLLKAHTHLIGHHGHFHYSNSVVRLHLGLIVPPCADLPRNRCSLRVVNEVVDWQVGKAFVFDDGLNHEAWNRTDQDRIVLIVDFECGEWKRQFRGEDERLYWQMYYHQEQVSDASEEFNEWQQEMITGLSKQSHGNSDLTGNEL